MKVLHWSHLRHMARSPAHFKHAIANPPAQTPAMRLGSLAHYLTLGASPHGIDYVLYGGQRRGNAWAEFKAEHSGDNVEIVTDAEWLAASDIAEAVKNDPVAAPLLENAIIEQRYQWSIGSQACAGTPDIVRDGYVIDLKTCADASPDRFTWQARRMGYAAQLAWYCDGVEDSVPINGAKIIAVESKLPCAVVVYNLGAELLEIGRRTYRKYLEEMLVCERTNIWPGYSSREVPLDAVDDEDLALLIDGEEVAL